jgi:hypothetical protein
MIRFSAFKKSKRVILFAISFLISQQFLFGQIDSKVKKDIQFQLNHMIETDQKYRIMLMYGEINQERLDSILKLPFEVRIKILSKQYTSEYNLSKSVSDSLWKLQNYIDSCNVKQLSVIIKQYGWPDENRFGKNDADVILLHANDQTIKEIQKLLLDEVNKKRLKPLLYANIWDKMLLGLGKKQIYGSIPSLNEETGKEEPPFIDNIDSTNVARQTIGLKKMKKYNISK